MVDKKLMTRRSFLRLTGLSAAGAFVAACVPVSAPAAPAQVPATQERTAIELWMPEYTPLIPYVKDAMGRFNEETPDVQANVTVFPHQAMSEKMNVSLAAGTGPDLLQLQMAAWTPRYMVANQLMAIPEDVFTAAEIKERFIPAALSTVRFNGNYYGLPMEIQGWSWKVNMSLVRAAGIEQKPTNAQEFHNLLLKTTIRDSDGKIIQAGTGIHWWVENWFWTYLESAGGSMFQVSPDEVKVGFNDDRGRQLMHAILDLFTVDKVWDPSLPYSHEGLGQGVVVSSYVGGWATNKAVEDHPEWDVDAFSYKIALPEVGPGGSKVASAPGWGYSVNAATKNPGAAWKLFKFFYREEEALKHMEHTAEPSSILSVLTAGQAPLIAKRKDVRFDFEDAKDGVWTHHPAFQEVEQEFRKLHDRVLLEGMSVEESMDVAERAMNEVMAKQFVPGVG